MNLPGFRRKGGMLISIVTTRSLTRPLRKREENQMDENQAGGSESF